MSRLDSCSFVSHGDIGDSNAALVLSGLNVPLCDGIHSEGVKEGRDAR